MRAYEESHYWDVAKRYEVLFAASHRVAPVIAQEYGVSMFTVHRWVREARRRGMLAPWSQRPERVR